jgi:hypothetical protein
MTFDSDLDQYYIEEQPTERCYYTAYDSVSAIAYGEYGGGFPTSVDPGSTSAYTVAELLTRIRTEIRDPDGTLYSDAELLNILDECNEWIMNQCHLKQATLGLRSANYVGDGTTEWGLPSDFLGLHAFDNPALLGYENHLKEVSKAVYDSGILALSVAGTRYYARHGNLLYFVNDIAVGTTINLSYYHRLTKLQASDAVPYDGVFMTLFVRWGVAQALAGDEFSIGFESEMLGQFMELAKSHLVRSMSPRSIKVGNLGNNRAKNLGYSRSKRGRKI